MILQSSLNKKETAHAISLVSSPLIPSVKSGHFNFSAAKSLFIPDHVGEEGNINVQMYVFLYILIRSVHVGCAFGFESFYETFIPK